MSSLVHYGPAAALALIGVLNLALAVRRRESPAERLGCVLAAAASLLLGGALLALSSGRHPIAIAAAALGVTAFAGWIRHVYRQSLHNTAM